MPPPSEDLVSGLSSSSDGLRSPAALDRNSGGMAYLGGHGESGGEEEAGAGASDGYGSDLASEGYGESDFEEEYVADAGPAEWAEVDEQQLHAAALHLCAIISGTSKTEAAARPLGGVAADAEHVDPLGLGGIDVKAKMLSSRRVVGAPGARGQRRHRRRKAEHADSLTRGTQGDRLQIIPTSDRFDPELYLALIHSETTLDELVTGTHTLEVDVADRKTQLKDLVKDNFERFISCKRTIDDIHARLRESESDASTSGVSTYQLAERVEELRDETQRTFSSLLERHQQVERVRTVISLLRRFSLLFSLPTRIRMHADAQDHEAVISEYRRARQMVGASGVTIWASLMKEVDKVVEQVVDDLIMHLVTPSTPPEDAIDSIRNLLLLREINAPGTGEGRLDDPVSVYLATQKKRYMDKIEEFSIDHGCKMTNLWEKMHERAEEDSRWMELQSDSATDDGGTKPSRELTPAAAKTQNGNEADLLASVYGDGGAANGGRAEQWGVVEVDGQQLFAPQAMLVKFEMRLTALVSRQLAEVWLAFSGQRERNAQLEGEISRKVEELEEVVAAVAAAYASAMKQLLADLGSSGKGAFDGLLLVMRHLKQTCAHLEADKVAPLQAHLAEVGWAATHQCVQQLCAKLALPSAWLADQETWEPLPVSCYTEGDPVSHTPILLAQQLGALQQQLSTVAAAAAAFPQCASSKRQLSHERQVESKLADAFYNCLHNYGDAVRKLSNTLTSGSSQSSGISTKVDFDGEEAQPLLLLLRNNVTFVRSQLLPSTAETLLTLLRVLQPMRSARRSRQRSAAAPAADLLLPSSEAYQLVRQELRQLAEELLATYCAMKEAALTEVSDRVAARFDQGLSVHHPKPTAIGKVVVELVNAAAALHAEVVTAAPSQVSAVLNKIVGQALAHLAQAVANIQGPVSVHGATQLLLELRYLEAVLLTPLGVSEVLFDRPIAATMKKISGAKGGLQEQLEDEVALLLPRAVESTAFNVACFQGVVSGK